jgi:hypothetical protein
LLFRELQASIKELGSSEIDGTIHAGHFSDSQEAIARAVGGEPSFEAASKHIAGAKQLVSPEQPRFGIFIFFIRSAFDSNHRSSDAASDSSTFCGIQVFQCDNFSMKRAISIL